MSKTYSNTYLYRKYTEYDKKLFEFIMKADRINTSNPAFEDLLFDIKRRKINDSLIKVLQSQNVVLCMNPGSALPKAFKVFVADDVATDRKPRVFIDVTDCVFLKDGAYVCQHIDWVISYLINATTSFIYKMAETKLTNNASLTKDGCDAFVKCFSYIIDRIYKISTVQSLRKRVEYAAALYYQCNILGKDYSKNFDSIKALAMRIVGIETKDAQIVDIMIEDGCFLDINNFVDNLARMFKFKDLNLSIIIDKWMQSFGTGTVFALEYFPAFAAMMTNTYIGGYIDNQLTIEKLTSQSMVSFSKNIIQIGASVS